MALRKWLRGLWHRLHRRSANEDATLQSILREAWSRVGMLDRADDPSFPYSALFKIPQEALRDEVSLRALISPGGVAVECNQERPRYQEKLTIPFFEAVYERLRVKDQIKPSLSIGTNLHLATAPLSSIYPSIHREAITQQYYVVFDSGMMFYSLVVTNAIWAIGEQLQKLGNQQPSLEDVLCYSSPTFLVDADKDVHSLAESLFNLVANDWPIPTVSGSLQRIYTNPFAAQMIGDLYTFCLAHELSHVELGHFDGEISTKQPRMFLEIDADTAALAKTLQSRIDADNTFPGYVATFVLFETMALIYRTVNFLSFRKDYRKMSPEAMTKLYFPDPAKVRYPHPRTRLYALMERVKHAHPEFADRTDRLEYHARAFFDTVWVSLESRMEPMKQKPTKQWQPVVDLHQAVHSVS